jgi:hypothetical protein
MKTKEDFLLKYAEPLGENYSINSYNNTNEVLHQI